MLVILYMERHLNLLFPILLFLLADGKVDFNFIRVKVFGIGFLFVKKERIQFYNHRYKNSSGTNEMIFMDRKNNNIACIAGCERCTDRMDNILMMDFA